jgi:hypothetical protein
LKAWEKVLRPKFAFAMLPLLTSLPATTWGQEAVSQYPRLGLTTSSQLLYKYWGNGRSIFYADIEPELTLNISQNLDLYVHLVLEPNGDIYRQNGTPPSEVLYAEELYWRLKLSGTEVEVGKFDPVFGLFADNAPGLLAKDIADGYTRTGVLGGAIRIPLSSREIAGDDDDDNNEKTIEQSLDLSVFAADHTLLKRSLPSGVLVDAFSGPVANFRS